MSSGKKKPSQFIVDDSVDYEDDDDDEEEMESNEDDKDDSGIVDAIISNIGDEEVSLRIIAAALYLIFVMYNT